MTNFKIVFKPTILQESLPSAKELPLFMSKYFSIPLGYISKADKKIIETKKGTVKTYQCYVELHSKDHRVLRFDFFDRVDDCTNTHNRINVFAFPEQLHDIFAFQYTFPV